MEYKIFENNFFNNLKNQNSQCINDITVNQDIIKKYLCNEGSFVNEFVEKLNDVILHHLKKVDLINKVLQNELFETVLSVFRESNILLCSCMNIIDEKIIKWILKMDTNPYHVDKYGMNALMYAAKSPALFFVVQHFIDTNNEKVLNHIDNNGETVLFHSLFNYKALVALIKTSIDVNHQNNRQETLLVYCSKHENARIAIQFFSGHPQLDPNILDEEGMTAPLYLIENSSHRQLDLLKNIDMNYRCEKTNDNVMSLLFKKLYDTRNNTSFLYLTLYLKMFKNFNEKKVDLNVPIDEDGNIPLMYFIMIHDKVSIYYLVTEYSNLDINVKNRYGEDAILLCIKFDYFDILDFLMKKKKYKYDCHDEHHNSILVYWTLKSYISEIEKTFIINDAVFDEVNDNDETVLIVATKLGNVRAVKELIKYRKIKSVIDHQDFLGNTALYYAIEIEAEAIVNCLLYHHADLTIKNNKGQSPYELAEEIGNEVILDIIEKPVDPQKYGFQKTFSSFKSKTKSLVKVKGKKVTNISDTNYDTDFQLKSKYQTIISYSMENPVNRRYQPYPDEDKRFTKYLYFEFYQYPEVKGEEPMRFVGNLYNERSKQFKRIGFGIQIASIVASAVL